MRSTSRPQNPATGQAPSDQNDRPTRAKATVTDAIRRWNPRRDRERCGIRRASKWQRIGASSDMPWLIRLGGRDVIPPVGSIRAGDLV